jgi:hypothetical protein
MIDTKMPVQIFRDGKDIGAGELLPNGAEMAVCPDEKSFQLLKMQTDTNAVEDRIPMTFLLDAKCMSEGQLYYSGEYICLCPNEKELDLLVKEGSAKLFVDKNGTEARLEVCSPGH